ncbi:MAG TPA: hypothetical protein VEV17_09235, partial [Bryobacteraceae bacterium]|nr:hypothetical protein [Bryobacteraceae bacterium]
TYTVMHGKAGPEYSVIIGRLAGNGRRFIANTSNEAAVLCDLRERESLGRAGWVRGENGRNLFVPDATN